jgi:hypothetical protein
MPGRDAGPMPGPSASPQLRARGVVADRLQRPLYPVSRLHLAAMTDQVGIWQHARGEAPDRKFGYCTDDVARSLVVDVLHARQGYTGPAEAGIWRSLAFLGDALDHASGRFLNFRRADGGWLEAGASEDCHARALAGLAAVMAGMPGSDPAERARQIFEAALPAATGFQALRSISRSLLACDAACEAGLITSVMPAYQVLAGRLSGAFAVISVDSARPPLLEWPWPESTLTYETALMPHALIVLGRRLARAADQALGLAVLDWLVDVQTSADGAFCPIGNSRWWPRGGERSRYDQQPIEAATLLAAVSEAYVATRDRRYVDAAESAYGWYLGDNIGGVAVADPVRGSCHDGLTPSGVNANRGAESTLMWLTALELTRELRRLVEAESTSDDAAEPAVSLSERGVGS